MNKLLLDGPRLKIALPAPGLHIAATIVLSIFMIAGFLVGGMELKIFRENGGFSGLYDSMGESAVAMTVGMTAMTLAFILIPASIFIAKRRSKEDWIKPHAFVFDNSTRRLEVFENADSKSAEAWVPYSQIASFDVDSYVVTHTDRDNRRSTSTEYFVARMIKKDGSTWDLGEDFRKPSVEDFVRKIVFHLHARGGVEDTQALEGLPSDWFEREGDTAPAGFEGSAVRRESTLGGTVFLWPAKMPVLGVIIGLLVVIAIGAVGFFTGIGSSGIEALGANIGLLAFLAIDAIVAVLVIGALIRAIGRANSDQALRFGREGMEAGVVRPRGSQNFRVNATVPFGDIHSVSFNWSQRDGNAGVGQMVIFDESTVRFIDRTSVFLRERRLPTLEELSDLLRIQSGGTRLFLGNLRLSDALRLEAAIEEEIAKRGGDAQ